jgi:aquaporin Z
MPLAARRALHRNWREYLIEAWALGMFMVSAGVVTTALESSGSLLHAAIPDPTVRRALCGLAMGLTAIGLIYSPWGGRSGAHMNPAVTLAFLSLGKISRWDALFYSIAQTLGAIAGVLLVRAACGEAFAAAPVSYVVTVPGPAGTLSAFLAELLISFLLMSTVLIVSSSRRWSGWTGVCAGILVATYVTVEAPLSGMSMNPARTLGSAIPSQIFSSLWIYFTAPITGMWSAARVFSVYQHRRHAICAKSQRHSPTRTCIHCGYTPAAVLDEHDAETPPRI